ncbi:CPBP family intramembrane glutamic endopeptidase [Shimazuella kribbensis]|uniref:CPBP family intramembrane glutamic endopeptidase n=1 Tax=Shimazuella kribbensis TaxID=139808 RepID=UPI000414072E|nr:type II CAAX endopeptidase family protein [Shimazuella kribbensis]
MEENNLTKFKLFLMVAIYFVTTSIAAFAFGILQPHIGVPTVIIQFTQFGPTIGVLVIALIFFKQRGWSVSYGLGFTPIVLRRLLVVIAMVVVIFAISIIWFQITGNQVDYKHPFSLSEPFWIIIIAQFIGAAGEEFGWRCFLQPLLQSRFSVTVTSIIVGLLWGVWHVGIFAEGWLYTLSFLLFTVSISLILGELLRKTNGSNLIIATLFHTLINLGLLLFFKEESGNVVAMATTAVACFIVAVAIIWIHAIRSKSSSKDT